MLDELDKSKVDKNILKAFSGCKHLTSVKIDGKPYEVIEELVDII